MSGQPAWIPRLEGFILDRMSRYRVPGISASVLSRDGVLYSRGHGFKDLERLSPADAGTLYGIGSVTKSFTCASIMILQEEGRLSIDDYVDSYVSFNVRPGGERVKIWHLMSHTSGIPALAYAEAYIRSSIGEEDAAWLPISRKEDVLAFLSGAEAWAVSRPGERYFYLNEGYVALGLLIERASGLKYEDFVGKRILEPLEMRRSYFSRDEVERDGGMAAPYAIDREGRAVRTQFPYGVTSDGGLVSNVEDMAKYAAMLMNRGRLGGVEILSRESVEEMERIRITYPHAQFPGEGYGLGLRVVPSFLGTMLVGHGGSLLVHTAYMGYAPERGVGVVVLENSSAYPPANVGMYAMALAMDRDPERELEFIRAERTLERLAGVYETFKSTTRVRVEKRGPVLAMVSRGRLSGFELPLVPERLGEGEHEFFVPDLGRRIPVIFRESEGRVEMIYERYKFVRKAPLPL